MEPTLHPAERVLVSKLSYRFGEPERGDIVILQDPRRECGDESDEEIEECEDVPAPSLVQRGADWARDLFGLPGGSRRDLVKRVVGLPGEKIEMKQGRTYIDGEEVELPTTARKGPQLDDTDLPARTLKDDQYFVMGDNRESSSDSRVFGAIERNEIVGRVFVVIWPPTQFRGL